MAKLNRVEIGLKRALCCWTMITWLATSSWAIEPAARTVNSDRVDYNRDVRPILSNHCFKCHGPDAAERKSGLRLDQRDSATRPAESGAIAVVAGDVASSELWRRVNAEGDEHMPPASTGKKLTAQELATLSSWIRAGAKYQAHWSYVAPQRPAIPDVRRRDWARQPIDQFLLARLESEQLEPTTAAGRSTLIRRLYLDLLGLPPTPQQVEEFLHDSDPHAYERLVDQLLDNPHYGERMALDWLDAARYADTHGFHIDSGRDMTRWREWVIEAFNTNMPFDQFTIEQLAGDLLPNATVSQQVASGFHRNHMINFEGGAIPEEYHTAYIIDRVNTTGTVFLGLSIACAQCHDHKYDPITQREYYQLFAFFHNVPEKGLDGNKGNASPMISVPSAMQQSELARINGKLSELELRLVEDHCEWDTAELAWEAALKDSPPKEDAEAIPEPLRTVLAIPRGERSQDQSRTVRLHFRSRVHADGKELFASIEQLRKERLAIEQTIPTAMVMQEMEKPRDTFILTRGQYDKPGDRVSAGVPAFLPSIDAEKPANRLTFARWLVAPEHPLMARVAVNRFWQAFFGTGLVKTAEDFGLQGELPSHPELLDWLAVEFQTGEQVLGSPWNVKGLVKMLVTSAAYRQNSGMSAEIRVKDPENRLLARGPRFRLPAEFIRDQALSVSGLLDNRIGGISVSPYQPPGIWEELASRADGKNWTAQEYQQSHGADLYRRSMYTFWKRTAPPPTLVTFDAPDRETCVVRRARTNTPLQALILMNDPTYVEAARKLAERIVREGGTDLASRLRYGFRLVVCRAPDERELEVLQSVYLRQVELFQGADRMAELLRVGESPADDRIPTQDLAVWTVLSSVLLNLDETLTRG